MADSRSFTSGRFSVNVDGVQVGYVKKVTPPKMEADIATNDVPNWLGQSYGAQKKHVANVKWSEAKMSIGIGMGKGMYSWIQSSFARNYAYKNGSIISGNFNYDAQSELTFSNALITKVGCPKLDGGSKDAAYFDISFTPEQVRWAAASGKIQGNTGAKQKSWLCSNFKFEMGGLPCARVATIDAWEWKQSTALDQIGTTVEPTIHAAKVTVPDLKITVSKADFDPWAKAAKSWFVDGQHLESNEMGGRIVFLGPDMKTELGEVVLQNCGFKSFAEDDGEANSEKVARFTVEFYVESMQFNINSSAVDA